MQHIELEFLEESRIACSSRKWGRRDRNKKGWSDGLVLVWRQWFTFWHATYRFFSLPFHSPFTAILPVNKKQERRQGNEIHNTRGIIGTLSCLRNMTTALIQYSRNISKRTLSGGGASASWEPGTWRCSAAVRVYERFQILVYEIWESNRPVMWYAVCSEQKYRNFSS